MSFRTVISDLSNTKKVNETFQDIGKRQILCNPILSDTFEFSYLSTVNDLQISISKCQDSRNRTSRKSIARVCLANMPQSSGAERCQKCVCGLWEAAKFVVFIFLRKS